MLNCYTFRKDMNPIAIIEQINAKVYCFLINTITWRDEREGGRAIREEKRNERE